MSTTRKQHKTFVRFFLVAEATDKKAKVATIVARAKCLKHLSVCLVAKATRAKGTNIKNGKGY
ncbi:hypothetical protein [Lactococcus lactis]|uniref:hypothetical protein n=1 Tax=Lactococcus lactis TaxID=1358 RepID=UPI00177F9E4F|nr:hypothetical protein [Lactococcus lactis]MBD5854325.1 hypothetical protein [Lactococcus lactis]